MTPAGSGTTYTTRFLADNDNDNDNDLTAMDHFFIGPADPIPKNQL